MAIKKDKKTYGVRSTNVAKLYKYYAGALIRRN